MRSTSTGWSITVFLLLLLHNGCSMTSENNTLEAVVPYQPLPRVVIPQSYEIKLVPEIVEGNLIHHGEVKIGVKVLEEIANLTLHSRDLCFDQSFTNLVDAIGVIHKPKNHILKDNRFLIIEFEQTLDVGIYTVNLKFASNTTISSGISVLSRNDENGEKVWTIFTEASVSRSALFPSWDEPDLKAIFNVSIRHFSNYTAVSNMPVRHSYLDEDGNKWTNFEVTPPLSTSLVFFVISYLECIRSGNEMIYICDTEPNFNFAREVSEKTLDFMVKRMGFETNLTKIDLFAMPYCDCTKLMSGPGLIMYRKSAVTYDAAEDPTRTKINVAWTVVSGLIHQWTANPVSSRSESSKYAWVISGLSTYLKYYMVDKLYPFWRTMDTIRGVMIYNQEYAHLESDYYMPREWDSFEGGKHRKMPMFSGEWGAVVFHMLSNIVTEDVFNAGIAKFLNENQYRIITTDDLWDAIQSVYDTKNKESIDNLSIKQIMKPWIEQRGYPLLNVTRNYETGKVMITQQSNIVNETSIRWWVPINFATKSNPNFAKTTPTYWLKPGEETLVIDGIDKDDWIIVNLQITGFYRVDYDETNWRRIAEYMNSENYINILALNRVQLFSDLYYMITLNRQNITTFFELAKYLRREDDYIPWSHANGAVDMIRMSILDDSVDAEISNFFLERVDELIGKFGFEDNSAYNPHKKYKPDYVSLDDTTNIHYKLKPVNKANRKFIEDYSKVDFTVIYREQVLELVCSFGHSRCLELARSQLRANVENATENPISPNLDWWVKCSGAAGNEDYLLSMATASLDDTTYVNALGCSPNKTILWKYIEDVLAGELKAGRCQLYIALNRLVKSYPNRNRAQLHKMVFHVMNNFHRIYNYYEKTSIEENNPKNASAYATKFLKEHIYQIPTLDELNQVKDITSNFPVNLMPIVDEYINEQTKRIELSEKMSPIISKWIHENTSPISVAG